MSNHKVRKRGRFPELSRAYYGQVACGSGASPMQVAVYHGTQSGSARGTAGYLANNPGASVHELHDAKEGFKFAPDDRILCGVGGANSGTYHIEDCTFASWTRKVWFLNIRTLKFSAHQVAQALLRNDRKCHFIGLEEAEKSKGIAGLNGWTYHGVLSATSWCPSTHYDPARNAGMGGGIFPHKWFKRYVRWYYDHPHIHRRVSLNKKGQETKRSKRKRRKG